MMPTCRQMSTRLCQSIGLRQLAAGLAVIAAMIGVGCSSGARGTAPGLILFVPGVAGDGNWYRHITPAVRNAGDNRTIEVVRWGAPGPAFFMNFNNVSIHESAERKLADRIVAFRADHPDVRIDILTHSAGGGVALGALAKLPGGTRVHQLVLLHPSVSPQYPLSASLRACESITLFHSERDTTFLSWRTSTFGTYDNVKTKAAGNTGFDLSDLSHDERNRVRMVAYADADRALNNDGDHFGALSRDYLDQRVIPLFAGPNNR